MKYQVELDPHTFKLSIPELGITVVGGTFKENMRKLRELVPAPAIFLMPYLGAVHHTDWYDIDRDQLTEERVGQWTTIPWYEDERGQEEEIEEQSKKRLPLDWKERANRK
jgi:hypothetical protein